MDITINSTSLAKALKTAGKAVPGKASIPVLECFRLEAKGSRLIITACDMAITVKVPVRIIENREDGVCAVPAKKFSEHIGLLPDCEMTFTTSGSTATIAWAKGKTKVQMMDHRDWPDIPEPDGAQLMDMPAQELLRALSLTIPASARDDQRPAMNGVHFDILGESTRLVASDTKTLTYDTLECSTGTPDCFTVPLAAATLLKGAIRKESTIVRLTHDASCVCFNLGDVIIQTRKSAGKFPRYMTIIPSEKDQLGTAVADRESLIGSLRRLAACSAALRMRMTPLSIQFSARNTDTGSSAEEDCECAYSGEDMEIGISPERFLNVLENVGGEKISLSVTGPRKPVIATSGETGGRETSLSLFMPILLS